MNPGSLAPEALLFTNRLYCLSGEVWLCELCVCVCVCVCVSVCSSKRTGGGKGQEPLLRRHPHPIPRPPRSVLYAGVGQEQMEGNALLSPSPIYSCGGRLGGDCLDQRDDLGEVTQPWPPTELGCFLGDSPRAAGLPPRDRCSLHPLSPPLTPPLPLLSPPLQIP